MNHYSKNIELERNVAKLFIFFFPFKMIVPLYFLRDFTFGLGSVFSFVFCIIGLFLIVLRGSITFSYDEGTTILKRFALMFLACDLASLLMAFVLHDEVGTIGGEGTYSAVIKKILFSFAYIAFFFYGSEIWRILSKEEISSIIHKSITVCIVLGVIQVLVLYNFPLARTTYDFINSVFNAWPSAYITTTKRIALLTNEPAYGASYLVSFAVPFLLAEILASKNKTRNILKLMACTVLLYFTKSTTGYVLSVTAVVVFLFVFIRKAKKSILVRFLIMSNIMLLFGIVLLFSFQNSFFSSTVNDTFDKLLSIDNANSADRKTIVSVNTQILLHYPLFGVGNGNQGFFYKRFFPKWAQNAYTAKSALAKAETVLFDGGPFWSAFTSGYGILGIMLLFFLLKSSFRLINRCREELGYLFYFYSISIIILIVNGFASTQGNAYYMWFIMSMPVALSNTTGIKNEYTTA